MATKRRGNAEMSRLIRKGIRDTNTWFLRFLRTVQSDYRKSKSLEHFLERTTDYTVQNILVGSELETNLTKLIQDSVNRKGWSRTSQYNLILATIQRNVASLMTDIGEEIQEKIKSVVATAYINGTSYEETANLLEQTVMGINNRRAKAIVRTEIKRTDTVANHIRALNENATGYRVICRPDCCPICAEDYADIENYDGEKTKGQYGKPVENPEMIFRMGDTDILPPRHPNCRCTVEYEYGEYQTIVE